MRRRRSPPRPVLYVLSATRSIRLTKDSKLSRFDKCGPNPQPSPAPIQIPRRTVQYRGAGNLCYGRSDGVAPFRRILWLARVVSHSGSVCCS
jgi:hypothetical protein